MLRWQTIAVTCSAAALCGCGQQIQAHGDVSGLVTMGTWKIRVSERPSRIDQLEITSKSVGRTERREPQRWIATSLLIHNGGDRAVRVDLAPTSTFIGHRRFLVTGRDCGYAQQNPGAPVKPGVCLAVLRALSRVAPGASLELPVRAFVGLPGMSTLAAGIYSRSLHLSIGAASIHSAVLTLTYDAMSSTASSWAMPDQLPPLGECAPKQDARPGTPDAITRGAYA